MKNNRRSDNFDYFSKAGSDDQKKKNRWKKIWYWTKIVLYVLLFALTMTGCVQTMVVKTSTHTGNGTEFYTAEDKISPSVVTFKPKKTTKEKENTLKRELKEKEFYELEENYDANFHLSKKEYGDVLEELRNQANSNKNEFGSYNSWSTAIQLVDSNNNFANNSVVYKTNNNKYIYHVDKPSKETPNKYQSAYSTFTKVKILNPSFDIKSFFRSYFYNATEDKYTSASKNFNPDLDNYTLYKPRTGKKDFDPYQIEDPKNKNNKYHASMLEVLSDKNAFGSDYNKLFARDVFEFLYTNTFFDKDNIYGKMMSRAKFSKFNNDYSKLMEDIISDSPTITSYSHDELMTIFRYRQTVINYLKKTNLISDKPNPKDMVLTVVGPIYDPSKVIGAPIDKNKNSPLILANYPPQKAVHSWGENWRHWGPFYGLFIWPVAWVTAKIREPMPSLAGWSTVITIIIAVIITRLIALGITWKAQVNQSKQEELRTKKARIDAKYAQFKGNKQMKMRQQQEVAQLYKKNGINPLDAFLNVIIAFPIFIAMWRVIQSVPELKSTHWLGMDFSATSWRRLFFHAEWQYLSILLVAAAVQILSQLMPRILNRKKFKERTTIEEAQALRKSNKTQNIMLIVFLVLTLIFSCGVQVYWICSGLWNIIQTIGIHYFKKSKYYRQKYSLKNA